MAAADSAERAIKQRQEGRLATGSHVFDPELLRQQVMAEPLRQLARRYSIFDVALAKRCKKLGLPPPGRGYWAKKSAID